MAILSGAMPTLAWSQGRGQGFRPCPYTPYQCPVKSTCKPFDEKGKVVSVITETLDAGMHPGMALVLDTKSRGQVLIHLAPVWYLERQDFELKPGDEVHIKGMCEKEKDGKLGVVAFELTKGGYVLHLRDSQGRPNWEAWRKMGN
ncbi:MAG: hypothetical protein ACOZF2_13565 [Thermodesulfobacteriota bacterium]